MKNRDVHITDNQQVVIQPGQKATMFWASGAIQEFGPGTYQFLSLGRTHRLRLESIRDPKEA